MSYVGYKITPTEVRKRPTLSGLFRLPTLCGVFSNSPDRPSFHITIRTSPIMSFSIHLPDCSKRSLNFTFSRFSTVVDYSPNLFQTSPGHSLLQTSTASDLLRTSTTIDLLRTSTASGLLQTSTVSEFHLSFYCK